MKVEKGGLICVFVQGKGKQRTYWLLGEQGGLSAQHSLVNQDDETVDEH